VCLDNADTIKEARCESLVGPNARSSAHFVKRREGILQC
jgi:hypothetical protein